MDSRPVDDREKVKESIWIRYQPRFGPWVPPLEVGDQVLATRNHTQYGIEQWEIGQVTEFAPGGEVSVGFHPIREKFFQTTDTSDRGIDNAQPEPYWSCPLVLLDRVRRRLPPLEVRKESLTLSHSRRMYNRDKQGAPISLSALRPIAGGRGSAGRSQKQQPGSN